MRNLIKKIKNNINIYLNYNYEIAYNTIKNSSLWNEEYYTANNPDLIKYEGTALEHYIKYGDKENRDPNPLFDVKYYRNKHLGLSSYFINTLYHYLALGDKNNNSPCLVFKPGIYSGSCNNLTNLEAFYLDYNSTEVNVQSNKTEDYFLINEHLTVLNEKSDKKTVIIIHIFYIDLIEEIILYLKNINFKFDILISTSKHNLLFVKSKFEKYFTDIYLNIQAVDNIGRDIAPFLLTFSHLYSKYDFACKIHTKKSLHATKLKHWRRHLLNALLGSKKQLKYIFDIFSYNPDVGIIYPEYIQHIKRNTHWTCNYNNVVELSKIVHFDIPNKFFINFPAGSMFWFRPKSLSKIFNCDLTIDNFESENSQIDGTLAHAIERSLLFIAEKSGYKSISVTYIN